MHMSGWDQVPARYLRCQNKLIEHSMCQQLPGPKADLLGTAGPAGSISLEEAVPLICACALAACNALSTLLQADLANV